MYNVSNEFKDLIKAPSRSFSAKVLINEMYYDDENIVEISIDESVNMDESFMVGSIASTKLELTMIGIDEISAQDATIKPSIGLEVNGVVEYVPLGIFYVDDIEKNKNTVILTCYDNMGKLEKEYISQLNYPAQLNQIASEICSIAGISLVSTLPSARVDELEDVTLREALSYIASFLGGFARFNRDGNLEIRSYQESNIDIASENYFELKTQEKPFVIGQIVCSAGEKILRAGTGGSRLSFENPWMTQSQLNTIYDQLSQISFLPYTMRWQGNPGLETGDKITIIDINENVHNTLLMEQKITYTGGLSANAAAKGETENKQEFNYQGSISKQLDGLQGTPRVMGTMLDLMEVISDVRAGTKVVTKGYYDEGDGGGAEYDISNTELDWSIYLGDDKYANITKSDYVSYRMFGAVLNGIENDTENIIKCHKYADSNFYIDGNNCKVFTCDVRNHWGIIHVLEPIYCSSNVDLSGSTILINDDNANWFGSYVWGENSKEYYTISPNQELKDSLKEGAFKLNGVASIPENTVLHMQETHYEIRDDAGYLYDVDKGELMVHQQGGIFSTSLGSDWDTAGGTLVYVESSKDFLTTELTLDYTYIPTQHRTFIGCQVIFEGSANNYCSTIWVRGHNCTVKDFTFDPADEVLSNTRFKNSMIYVWGSYKVTIKNCNGFNASGKVTSDVPTPTSGYAIRAYQACDLYIEDCSIVGIWGSISVSSTKNCYLDRVTCNRIDVHDYIVNLFVSNCIVYSHALQIGSGSGVCSIRDTVFYHQYLPEERYPSSYLIALQAGYGRVFNGKINIQNCKYIYLTKDNNLNFYFVKVNFSPDSRSIERKFKFPEITIKDFTFDTLQPDNVFLSVVDAGGEIKTTTASTEPPVSNHIAYSGETKWDTVSLTKDWIDNDFLYEGQIIRKMTRELDSVGKVQFHSIQYYLVEETGAYSENPEEEWERPFSDLKRIYAPYYLPGAPYETVENENFVVAIGSKFFPEEVFSGNIGRKTKGNYPTHKSGTQWVGDEDGLEGLFLKYEQSNLIVKDWTPEMSVTEGQLFTIDTKVYEVIKSGKTSTKVLESIEWLSEVEFGTSIVKYAGSLWIPGMWIPEDGLALVYTTPGYNGSDFTYEKYRAVQRDGRAIGDNLLSASGVLLDGGIIWDRTDKTPNGSWQANRSYDKGQVISIRDVPHEVVYVQKLKMPKRLTLSNIIHSSNFNPFIFSFASGTKVPTEEELRVVIDNISDYRGVSYNDREFFGLSENLDPIIYETINSVNPIDITNILDAINTLDSKVDNGFSSIQNAIDDLTLRVELLEDGTEEIYNTIVFYENGVGRWDSGNVIPSPQQQIGRLEITNNNDEEIHFHINESYGHGDFTWTELKVVSLLPNEKAIEYVQLSGTRNNLVVQTRDSNNQLVDTSDCIIEMIFSNKSNAHEPTIICP